MLNIENQKLKIILVEDNFDDMEYCTQLLNEIPVEKILFRTGNSKRALEIIAREQIDIALIDIYFPDINGITLAKTITKMQGYQFLKIVFITGRTKGQLDTFKKVHCYDYITKPFSEESFKRKMCLLPQNLKQECQPVMHSGS